MRAVRHTHAAAHAPGFIHVTLAIDQGDGLELAMLLAGPAAAAEPGIHLADVTRRSQHRRAVALGLHGAAAARAAVADRIEAVEHRLLEEGVAHVAAFVLGPQDLHRLILADPARLVRMVLPDEGGERLAYYQAHIQWQARLGPVGTARALQGDDVIGILQDQIARQVVGDDL